MTETKPVQSDVARDPMVYDVMRETATWYMGAMIALSRAATTEDETKRWMTEVDAVYREVLAVDPRNQDLVRAKTAEYHQRRLALPGEMSAVGPSCPDLPPLSPCSNMLSRISLI